MLQGYVINGASIDCTSSSRILLTMCIEPGPCELIPIRACEPSRFMTKTNAPNPTVVAKERTVIKHVIAHCDTFKSPFPIAFTSSNIYANFRCTHRYSAASLVG